jgi:hypothetical protein
VFGSVTLYANAFSADRGRCFRWVRDDIGRPTRCPTKVSTRGWWQDGSGRWWLVDSCEEHADPLTPSRPARSRVGRPATVRGRNRQKRRDGDSNSRSAESGKRPSRRAA